MSVSASTPPDKMVQTVKKLKRLLCAEVRQSLLDLQVPCPWTHRTVRMSTLVHPRAPAPSGSLFSFYI